MTSIRNGSIVERGGEKFYIVGGASIPRYCNWRFVYADKNLSKGFVPRQFRQACGYWGQSLRDGHLECLHRAGVDAVISRRDITDEMLEIPEISASQN